MKIEYELTKKDYREFQKYHMAHAKISKGFKTFIYLLIPVIILIALANDGIFQEGITSTVWITLMMIVIMVGIFILMSKFAERNTAKRMADRLSKRDPRIWGWRSLEICKDGLVTANQNTEGKIYWNGIDRVEENTWYIFIYLNAVSAHIVPKAAFTDQEQEAAFKDLLRRKTNLTVKSHAN